MAVENVFLARLLACFRAFFTVFSFNCRTHTHTHTHTTKYETKSRIGGPGIRSLRRGGVSHTPGARRTTAGTRRNAKDGLTRKHSNVQSLPIMIIIVNIINFSGGSLSEKLSGRHSSATGCRASGAAAAAGARREEW